MLLNKQEKRKKDAIALEKERNALYAQIRKIQPIKLDKPIFDGYVKSLVLNSDSKNRSDYLKIKECLAFLGQVKVYSKDKNFLDVNKVEKKPGIKSIKDPRFRLFASAEKQEEEYKLLKSFEKYLRYVSDIYSCNCNVSQFAINGRVVPHYEFNYKELLEEKIDERFLTHYYPIDGEIESRLKQIDNKFNRENYWNILYGKNRDDYSWSDVKADAHKFYFNLENEEIL